MRILVTFALYMLPALSFADKLPDVQDVIGITPGQAISNFAENPNTFISDYTESPKESNLSNQDITEKGRESSIQSEEFQLSKESTDRANQVDIPVSDIQRAGFISDNAEAISKGVSNKYIDCQSPVKCEVKWSDATSLCQETPKAPTFVCTSNSKNKDCLDAKSYVDSGFCVTDSTKARCLSKNESGLCLLFEKTYQCTQSGNCEGFRNQGCMQESEKCLLEIGGHCVKYEKVYRCPLNTCPVNSNLICGETSLCLEGDCEQSVPEDPKAQEEDFKHTVNDLSVLQGAVENKPENFDKDTHFIFQGQAHECKVRFAGIRDCCQDKGWLKPLVGCSDSEKALQDSGKSGLTVSLGEYKTGHWYNRKKYHSYCVFPSKLAKEVQIQGRVNQLHRGMGSAKHPDCSGLSPEELSQINFDVIDYGEITRELSEKVSIPNLSTRETGAKESVGEMQVEQRRSQRVD